MINNTNSNISIKAVGKKIRISPHKMRKVIDQIRGRSYEQALMILEFMPYKACNSVLKLLSSVAANANHNFGLNKSDLFIEKIIADGGPKLKRFQPRAQGRGYPILKPTCNLMIVVKVKS